MIEITVLDYLTAALDCPVVMEYRDGLGEKFVVLRTGDTTRTNMLEATMFIAESYDSSLLETAKLNMNVKSAMDALAELPEISASHLVSDYPAMDTEHKRYRYQAVYTVTHY